MMKPALTLVALVTLSSAAFAQTAPNPAKFAAADISLRARTGTTNQPTMTGGVLRGGRYGGLWPLSGASTAWEVSAALPGPHKGT